MGTYIGTVTHRVVHPEDAPRGGAVMPVMTVAPDGAREVRYLAGYIEAPFFDGTIEFAMDGHGKLLTFFTQEQAAAYLEARVSS